jgi:UDP-N-acetylmuramyl tripeptide synthase
MSYREACKAVAKWIADARCENARDNDEDVTTWDNDSEEVIMLYLKDMAADIGKLVPAEIATILDEMSNEEEA